MKTYSHRDINRPELLIEGMPEHYTYYFRNFFDSDIWYDYIDDEGKLQIKFADKGVTFKKDVVAHYLVSELFYRQKYKGVESMTIEEIITLIYEKQKY